MRKTKVNFFVLSSFLLVINLSWADDRSCFDNASSTIGILKCDQLEIENLNEKLRAAYKNVEQQISEIDIASRSKDSLLRKLEISERSWELSMEDSCDFSGEQRGGSPMWVKVFSSECQIVEIKQRIKFFEVILSSPH